VFDCDGHDPVAIDRALVAAKASPRPAMIACATHIALGSSAQDTSKGHGALTDAKLIADTRAVYGWEHGPFVVPGDVKAAWEAIGRRGGAARQAWEARLATLSVARQAEFGRIFEGDVPAKLAVAIRAVKKTAVETAPKIATRRASEIVLEAINPVMTETIGGSADLTGSNNTKTPDMGTFEPANRKGRYVYYGIREHGMASAMNGMVLHGGVRPYGGTFMCFTDYARPAMRLSALMGVPVVYVMTHDSIGLGEDGPTHQPVEHLAISRATPNTYVIRPADLVETAEAWDVALRSKKTPTVLALSRQNLAAVRKVHTNENMVAKGAYVLAEATGKRQVILIATGSEVEIALKARDVLQTEGIGTRVVSMPSMELFAAQPETYRRRVLPAGPVRVAIEAGVRQGWDRWLLGERGREGKSDFVGMVGFGASAPIDRLYKEFGITAEAAVAKAKAML
jgi:transketolase